MQISRLFEIVYILLGKEMVTARELAERFEVSTRTIYRDVEALSQAGIPIYTHKGKNGGISLTENFVLRRSLLTEGEQSSILSALQGLDAIGAQPQGSAPLLSKLSSTFRKNVNNWIRVDFSDWGHGESDLFLSLQAAILDKKEVAFHYYGSTGERTTRTVQPLQLWFKHRAWYLFAHCLHRDAPRLFRLSRIHGLQVSERGFDREPDELPAPPASPPETWVELLLKIHPCMAYRVFDEFDPGQVERDEQDHFLVRVRYVEGEWVYGFLLSFGPWVEVLSPPEVRETIARRARETAGIYAADNPR